MSLKNYLLNYGGILGPKNQYGLIFYETNIAKDWWDNWSQIGALHYYLPMNYEGDHHLEEVKQVYNQGDWNWELMINMFTEEMCSHIFTHVVVIPNSEEWDRPWWMFNRSRKFSIKSA
ncbi:hypothetical protein H5410_003155 [Solanum commersonii]|uniref:Uncharacterized protein n=1 Tax=Solanum commersonii TaxID=4109 RepID=A0A9J6B3X1_SOLCO|nr:hypothetical protein H5410_003155 [Solanum commersonii]